MLKPVLPLSVCAINQRELLTCWKEIAAFFGKGIRTVQRWEKMGMPVHRPCQDRSVIFADPEELKGWALSRTDAAKSRKRLILSAG